MAGGDGLEKIPFPVSEQDIISSYMDRFATKACLNLKVIGFICYKIFLLNSPKYKI